MQMHSIRGVECDQGFGSLVHALETTFSGGRVSIGPDEYDALDAAVSGSIERSGTVAGLLAGVADAIRDNRLVRGNSHQHAHGFTKLALYRSTASGFSVRLHVWWTGVRAYDDSPHEHRWSFYSRLLSGSLRIRNFIEMPSPADGQGDSWHKYRYADATAEGNKTIEADGAAVLGVVSEYTLLAGSSHTLAPTEPHQVFGRDGAIAATLVITAPPARDYSNVYHKTPRVASAYSFAEQRLNNVQVAQLIERYCDCLDQAQPRPGGSI